VKRKRLRSTSRRNQGLKAPGLEFAIFSGTKSGRGKGREKRRRRATKNRKKRKRSFLFLLSEKMLLLSLFQYSCLVFRR
jgi:hypothetical protein